MRDYTRARMISPVREVMGALPSMGRVMLSASAQDVTHERIGPVERVTGDQGTLRLEGRSHDARLDVASIGTLVADRTGRMGERFLPRIQALGPEGGLLYALIALDGLEPFDAALVGLALGEDAPPLEPPPPRGDPPSPEGDAAQILIDRLAEEGASLAIEFASRGLLQTWSGKAAPTKPAMGFVNIIGPDFHLHVRAGAIGSWRDEDGLHRALAPDGAETGLTVRVLDA